MDAKKKLDKTISSRIESWTKQPDYLVYRAIVVLCFVVPGEATQCLVYLDYVGVYGSPWLSNTKDFLRVTFKLLAENPRRHEGQRRPIALSCTKIFYA